MKGRNAGIIVLLIPAVFLDGCIEQPRTDMITIENIRYIHEVIPVLAKFSEELEVPILSLTIKNPTNEARHLRIYAEVRGWSDPYVKNIVVNPREEKIEEIYLVFDETRLMANTEKQKASLYYSITENDAVLLENTLSVWIHAKDDVILSIYEPYDTADIIAAWVTPRHPSVKEVLAIAKERVHDRTLMGCQQGMDEQRMYNELRAIYDTLNDLRLSYVSVTVSYAPYHSQRVNLPSDSLRYKSFNCIDGSVLFASFMEALDIEPTIILVPGHVFVCGYCKYANTTYCIETTFIGQESFVAAIEKGVKQYYEHLARGELRGVNIAEMRKIGITPLE